MRFDLSVFGRKNARGLSGDVDDIPILNPTELPEGSRASRTELFRMWASTGGTPVEAYVWADHLEDAWEEFVEFLDETAPGVFVTIGMDELKEAANDLGIPWKTSWPDWNDPRFEKVVEHAETDMTIIGHTTLKSGGTHIPSDHWGGSEVTDKAEYNEVWTLSAEDYEESNESDEPLEAPQGVTRTRPSLVMKQRKGLKIDTNIEGLAAGNRRTSGSPDLINTQGLTWKEWYAAASGGRHVTDSAFLRVLFKAWRDDEDPTKYRDPINKLFGSTTPARGGTRKGVKINTSIDGLSGARRRTGTREENILHQTENLYLYQTPKGLEIRLMGLTHSVVVGTATDVESAKRAMARLERYPDKLRAMYKMT